MKLLGTALIAADLYDRFNGSQKLAKELKDDVQDVKSDIRELKSQGKTLRQSWRRSTQEWKGKKA
jgi:uncharacterized protein YukE